VSRGRLLEDLRLGTPRQKSTAALGTTSVQDTKHNCWSLRLNNYTTDQPHVRSCVTGAGEPWPRLDPHGHTRAPAMDVLSHGELAAPESSSGCRSSIYRRSCLAPRGRQCGEPRQERLPAAPAARMAASSSGDDWVHELPSNNTARWGRPARSRNAGAGVTLAAALTAGQLFPPLHHWRPRRRCRTRHRSLQEVRWLASSHRHARGGRARRAHVLPGECVRACLLAHHHPCRLPPPTSVHASSS
jgi:hypothetical protein